MSKKFIIELEDEPSLTEDGVNYYKCAAVPWWSISDNIIKRLVPYEPGKGTKGEKCEFCSVYGYPVRDLALFAYACRENGVEEQDMRFFAQNAESAYAFVRRDMEEALDRAFNSEAERLRQEDERAFERFQTRQRRMSDE